MNESDRDKGRHGKMPTQSRGEADDVTRLETPSVTSGGSKAKYGEKVKSQEGQLFYESDTPEVGCDICFNREGVILMMVFLEPSIVTCQRCGLKLQLPERKRR